MNHNTLHPIHERLPHVPLKKPPQRPRLLSFGAEDEQQIYSVASEAFGHFLKAAIHTGLRPFCELARLTSTDVLETERDMMWRVFAATWLEYNCSDMTATVDNWHEQTSRSD